MAEVKRSAPPTRERGHPADALTQRWVRETGRAVRIRDHPWLAGPVGDVHRIGRDYFDRLAERERLRVRDAAPDGGLMDDFSRLAGPGFAPDDLHQTVRSFYEHTSRFQLDVWSEWSPAFRPFGRLLAAVFSRRLQQLNVPISPLSTSRGMTSNVLRLEDPETGALRATGWLRQNPARGDVVYAGVYSVAIIPGHVAPCVKVVFPLPNGSATVLLRPAARPDGSLVLESSGEGFGCPGFYFVVRDGVDLAHVRYVRSFRERIRVYVDEWGELRTDHVFTLFRLRFLQLHYRLRDRG